MNAAQALLYDPDNPPMNPPEGCENRLMWQLARRLFSDHQPGLDGCCLGCRPYQFYPCVGRQLANIGLVAAYRQPEEAPWHATVDHARSGPETVMSVLKPGDEDLHYSDGSHRWTCPDLSRGQDAWSERVKAHMKGHG